jgi:DNA-binding response OmpR family regulator
MKRKIIFVDDETNILDGLKRMLHDQEEAWDMSFCSHPAQALEMMQADSFDAAIIDVNMPGMTGIEMLTEIKNQPHTREMEVIILTGQQEQGLKREALSLGASDLLNKPVLKEDLLARLRNALRNKALRDELAARRNELEKQLIYAQRMELASSLAEHAARSLAEVMSAIVWYSKLAEQLLEMVVEENADIAQAKENLRAIQQSGAHAKQLMGYVLSLSQQAQDPWQRIDLAQLVSEVINVAKALAPRGFSIDHSAPECVACVNGDPAQLFQMMLEIVLYAIEHTHAGNRLELKLSQVTELSLAGELAGDFAAVEVREVAGLGPAKPTPPVTDKLQPAVKSAVPGQSRQAVAHRIAGLHGGNLAVSDSPSAGISILLRLPLTDTISDAIPDRANEA